MIRILRRIGTRLAVIAALPFLWLVCASALFCKGTGLPFAATQYWQALGWWGANWFVTLWLILAAVVPTIFLSFVAFGLFVASRWSVRRRRRLVSQRGGPAQPVEQGVSDNHGHAAWASPEQIAKRFGTRRGCLIGALTPDPKSPLLFDDLSVGPGHSMIIAGPGSHKTTSAIHRIWNWSGPRVVFDPSLEIGPIMTLALQRAGFNVRTVGLAGSGVNVLDWIDISHPEADTHIRTAVDWIYAETAAMARSGDGQQTGDPFWGLWGRALVTCLLSHLLHTKEDVPKTLAALRQGIATPENQMQALMAGISQTSNSAMARDIAGGLMGMKAEETFSSIYSNAFSATEWLSVGAYADAVSGNAVNTSEILDSNTIVFVQIPLRTLLTGAAIGRAVMGAFFNAMFHADGQGIAETILFQIDEARVLGPMKEIMLCHTTARKYRGAVSTIWQSEGQIEGVWGREGAKELRDTCSWRSYNAVQDGSIAEQLSRDIGEHAVLAYSEGDNRGTSKRFGFALPSSNTGMNTNTHEIKRRLIKADEILRAPADQMFVLARDFPHPITCFSAPYFRYPAISKVMAANRFARTAA